MGVRCVASIRTSRGGVFVFCGRFRMTTKLSKRKILGIVGQTVLLRYKIMKYVVAQLVERVICNV